MSVFAREPAFGSSGDCVEITKSDTVNLKALTKYVYVGGTGIIVFINQFGAAVTLQAVPVGFHPIRTTRINSTTTSATNMVAFF
jgi:hypothetical protein